MKRAIATSILTVILTGAVANGLASWRELGIIDNRVKSLEDKQKTFEDKIDDIHWFLIEKNNVKINRKSK